MKLVDGQLAVPVRLIQPADNGPFRRTFRSFVLANFKANDVAAQPIIYRRTAATGSSSRRP